LNVILSESESFARFGRVVEVWKLVEMSKVVLRHQNSTAGLTVNAVASTVDAVCLTVDAGNIDRRCLIFSPCFFRDFV